MPVRRRRPHLAWLRTLLLIALVAVVAGVVGLYYFGRAGQRREPPQVAEEAGQATEGTVLVGRDFDYTYTEGERPLFHIRGDSIRANREQTIFLDGVSLTLYDPEGRAYQVESKVASFNQTANEGELSGAVHLQGPNGLDFRSEALRIAEKGRLLVAPGAVRIRFLDRYVATAASLRFHLEQELYVLSGKVVVKSTPDVRPPVFMRSAQLVYERKRRLVRLEGKAFLARGGDQLESGRINGYLTDDEKGLSFVRAIWNVAGSAEADSESEGRTRLTFKSDDLAVLMQAGDPRQARQVELDSARRGGVVIRAAGGGVTRVLSTKRVVGMMAGGVLETASAFRGVDVREAAARGKPERRLSGEQAELGFQPNGQIGSAGISGGVKFTDGDLSANGDRGRMDFATGRGEFFGDPVDVRSRRGRLLAPHVVYTQNDSLLHADGGVRATLEEQADRALGASLPGEGEGPVRVESREAFFRERPRSFFFRGDVRAWRGESVLTAADLRGDEEGNEAGKVTATKVKSLWVPAAPAAGPASAAAAAAGRPAAQGAQKEAGPRQPIEVTAAQLVYTRPPAQKGPPATAAAPAGTGGTGLLTYTGDVRVEQEGRTLLCQRLDVILGPKNRAETMTAVGQVRFTDPEGGRTIEGERAVYRLGERVIEIFGDPVTLRDKDGNQLRGRQLVYHVEDGRVEVKGQGTPAPVGAGGGA